MPADLLATLHHTLNHFEAEAPQVPELPTQADLKPWRVRIDEIDSVMVQLLNERSRCANIIGHLKKKLQIPVYAPRREEEVLRHVIAHNQGPLPDDAVRNIFERIIDETRSLERYKYQDEPDP